MANLNDVVETTIQGTLFGQTIMSVLHFQVTQASTIVNPIEEMETLAGLFADIGVNGFGAAYLACVPSQYTMKRVSCQVVHPVRERRGTITVDEQGSGGTGFTPNVSQAITTFTGFAGRAHIGGLRLPLAGDRVIQGYLTAGATAALGLLSDLLDQVLVEPVGAGQYTPVIYHRKPMPGGQVTKILGAFPQPEARVMRRRTVGLGI